MPPPQDYYLQTKLQPRYQTPRQRPTLHSRGAVLGAHCVGEVEVESRVVLGFAGGGEDEGEEKQRAYYEEVAEHHRNHRRRGWEDNKGSVDYYVLNLSVNG